MLVDKVVQCCISRKKNEGEVNINHYHAEHHIYILIHLLQVIHVREKEGEELRHVQIYQQVLGRRLFTANRVGYQDCHLLFSFVVALEGRGHE